MRLTLRILLAYKHGLLPPELSEEIARRVQQNHFVTSLLDHIADRAHRAEIHPLGIHARGSHSISLVAGYLDHLLPEKQVVALENECLGSDRLLSEITACHEIVTQRLSQPTLVPSALRNRLYALVQSETQLEDTNTYRIDTMEHSVVPVPKHAGPAKLPHRRNYAFAVALSVLILCGVFAFVFQSSHPSNSEEPVADRVQSQLDLANYGTEIAASTTTAFDVPIPPTTTGELVASSRPRQKPRLAWGSLRESDGSLSVSVGTITVACNTERILQKEGMQCRIIGPAEVATRSEGALHLKYGRLELELSGEQDIEVKTDSHSLQISAPEPCSLQICTYPEQIDGIDYARYASNQSIAIASVRGDCIVDELFAVRPAQPVAVSGNGIQYGSREAVSAAWEQWLLVPTEWEQSVSLEDFVPLVDQWNLPNDPTRFQQQADGLRFWLAQKSNLAGKLQRQLEASFPDEGPLAYRLICGFSEDHRTDSTKTQLRSLENHPTRMVQRWADYNLKRF